MSGNALIDGGLNLALGVMVILLLACSVRVIRGPSPADRLQAIDTLTTLLIGIIVILVLIQDSSFLIDVGIALAAFAFVGTVAIARYLSEGRMF
jgi:multisubunit Na+/H+ antiporter MnhF subunit